MLTLARYTLKGPLQAASVIGLLAVLAVFILPLAGASVATIILTVAANLLAVVLVGLIILTQGLGQGMKVIASSALAAMLAAWLALKSPESGISMVVLQWLPVIVLTQVLRVSRSLAVTVLAGVAVGLAVLALQALFWSELENTILSQLMPRVDGVELSNEQKQQIGRMALGLMIFFAPSLYLSSMLIVFFARWMQARLAETTGFGQEFQALELGKPAALVALVIVALGLWQQQGWLASIAFLLIIAFMFQGVAVVHCKLGGKKQGFALLLLYYVLMIFLWNITGILTSITGIIDNWLGFRRKPGNPAV